MKTNRRVFLKTTGLASTALSLGFLPGCKNNQKMKPGLILNTVRDHLKKDYQGTLKAIAETGYTYIEGVPGNVDPGQFVNDAKALGLVPLASGSALYQLQNELDKYLDVAKKCNHQYIVCYWPWPGSADNLTIDDFKTAAKNLDEIGQKCADQGVRFAFHNHDKEFKDFNGTVGMDIILENTKPELVTVELDLYWIIKAGYDPVEYFKKFPGRYELFHVKDMDNTEVRERTCVGDGVIDFAKIFSHANTAGVKYYIVEQEVAEEEIQMQCMKDSYAHLMSLEY